MYIHNPLDAFVNFDFMVINDKVANTDDVVDIFVLQLVARSHPNDC